MKENSSKAQVSATKASGLHNDFSEQEETMTASAMPPKFALKASAAAGDPGSVRKPPAKPRLQIDGVPPELVLLLEKFEDIKWEVYRDSLGKLTGGMGHLIKEDEMAAFPEFAPISQEQVETWAQQDVGAAWKMAQSQSAELGVTDHDFMVAMASMCFQNGLYWNTVHVKTWTLMKEHKWEEAAVECTNSEWARQTPTRVPGFQAALRSQIKEDGATQPGQASGKEEHARATKHTASKETKRAKYAEAKARTVAGGESAAAEVPKGVAGMKEVQSRLQALGLYEGAIDGKDKRGDGKESNTTKGIKQFQEMKGLAVTGTVDAATWAALNKVESLSIWQQFMASLEEQRPVKPDQPKTEGLAAPFKILAAEAKKKAAGAEYVDNGVTGSGNFMADSNFISQLSKSPYASKNNPGGAACRKVASEMLLKYLSTEKPEMLKQLGLEFFIQNNKSVDDLSAKGNFLRVLEEDKSHIGEMNAADEHDHFKRDNWLVENEQANQAIAYIDGYLQQKIPVLIGVDHTYNRKLSTTKGSPSHASKTGGGYNEGTTDHFLTLSGIGRDEEGRKFYTFFDPGRTSLEKGSGSNVKNRLVHEGGARFKATGTGSNDAENYHLSMVVLFPSDREKFAAERKENTSSWID